MKTESEIDFYMHWILYTIREIHFFWRCSRDRFRSVSGAVSGASDKTKTGAVKDKN